MNTFGEVIRKFRTERKLRLRTVSAFLKIDPAILSKIERGQRKAPRDLVQKIALYYESDANELLIIWLSDNLASQAGEYEQAVEALQLAEEKVLYNKRIIPDRRDLINQMAAFFRQDGRITRAWLFGSFARGEFNRNSDIDLMVTYSEKASGTLLDYADIKQKLEKLLNCKIDLVEDGFIKSWAMESVERDKIQIYG